MDNQKILKKMFIGTMIVMIVAELSGALTAIIDGMITSIFLGSDKMSAVGIANSYFSVVSIISGVLMIGSQALIVEAISKGKKDSASKITSASLIVGFLIASLITLLLCTIPRPIAILFGASKNNTVMINDISMYFRGVSVGAPFWVMFVMLTPVVQIDGGGKYATIASIVMGIVDVICDLLFACVFNMDLFGMGLATGLSHVAACIVIFIFVLSNKSNIKFSFASPEFNKMPSIVANGAPRAVSMLGRTIGPILLNIIVLNIVVGSNVGMGALSIQRSISFTASSIGWGIGGALLIISSLYFNDRNYLEIKETIKYSIKMILLLVGVLSVILFFVSPLISKIYVKQEETELLELTTVALRYYFLSLPFLAFNVAFSNYMQSIKKNFIANVLNIMIECVVLVLFSYIFSLLTGYNGFFLGYFVGEAFLSLVLIVISLINYLSNKNIYKKLFLKPDFIKEGTVVYDKNIYSIEDAVNISESITKLCENTSLSPKQIYKLSLCVEEMATNIFEHGFKKDNKKHNVIIRIVIEGERVCLTTIDDCKAFDITKKLKSWEVDKEKPEKNIGIRMIMLVSKEIHYSNTMNINNLQIIL